MLGRRTIQLATIALLMVGFLFTSTSALAYWREVTVTKDVEVVTIGEPVKLLIEHINEGVTQFSLVPVGYAMAVGEVEYVELQYEVGVSRELIQTVDLYITTTDVLINDDDAYSHLVDIDIMGFDESATLDLYNDTLTITLTVRLIEPIDADEALAKGLDESLVNVEDSVLAFETIQGQNITFNLFLELQIPEEATTE